MADPNDYDGDDDDDADDECAYMDGMLPGA